MAQHLERDLLPLVGQHDAAAGHVSTRPRSASFLLMADTDAAVTDRRSARLFVDTGPLVARAMAQIAFA